MARHLARDLDVLLEKAVVAVPRSDTRWTAVTDSGEAYSAGAVVLTPPAPQALSIVESGGGTLDAGARARLASVEYEPALP